ncbi:MAG: hypothetical protein ACOZAI_04905 [Pseudomonadota bacterium]
MSGVDLNLATPTTGSADLALGGSVSPAPTCGPTDLCLSRPRVPGNADLNLGLPPDPAQAAIITADITLPEISVDARVGLPVDLTVDITLPEITVDCATAYLVNVWRGPQHSAASVHQEGGRLERETAGPWVEPQRLKPVAGDVWQVARRQPVEVASRHQDNARLRATAGDGWREATALLHDRSTGWDYPLRKHASAVLAYAEGEARFDEWTSRFDYPPRAQNTSRDLFREGQALERSARTPYPNSPSRRRHERRAPWGDAVEVISLWPRPDPWEPPEPPPPRVITPDLDLICPRVPGNPDLHFMIGCPALPTEPTVIPIQRAYIVIFDADLVRLSDGIPVRCERMSLEFDVDSWAWGFTATLLGRDALDAVMPASDGAPIELAASIQGHTWHLIVDGWTENRRFVERGISIKGRGLVAELAAPYELPGSGVTASAMTLQQVMNAHLPIGSGWSLQFAPGTPDWLIPAGAWSWGGKTPIQAIHDAAQQVGLVVVPSPTGRVLNIQPRYPVLPWDYASTTPDLIIPTAAIDGIEGARAIESQANAVYVHGGEVGGVLARVKRALSAGERVAETASSNLITHADGARLLGGRILAGQHQQPEIRSVTTLIGGDFPLAQVGQLLRVEDDADVHLGIINGVSVTAQFSDRPDLSQTIRIGEDTGNTWSRFRRLLPADPLLVGNIESVHADGTATVLMLGGGSRRVRGTGTAGQAVYVRGGTVEGQAPDLAQVEIDV